MSDVGMHGLLASQSCTVLYHLRVGLHCRPVADFLITGLHPYMLLLLN